MESTNSSMDDGYTQGDQVAEQQWWERPLRAVWVILGLNIVVFLLWQVAGGSVPLQTFLMENFLVSPLHLHEGLYWSILGSAFSHSELWHLFFNMIVLHSFGGVLERLLGLKLFVSFYLVAAVVSSLAHCAVSALLLGEENAFALGASGALAGLLIAYALLFPRHRILLFGIVPLPALAAAALFVGLDIWGLIAQQQGGGLPIGHGAHLGGAMCGLLFYFSYLRERFANLAQPPVGRRQVHLELTRDEAEELERIRDKIDSQGRDSLNPKEQAFIMQLKQRAAVDGHKGRM
ncbi:MAG: rhomboid family intramembrane serine protease [bacterium]|nr:rhomboid family intramembrane serine protease [bacterium]